MAQKLENLEVLERCEPDLVTITNRLKKVNNRILKGDKFTQYHSESCMLQLERIAAYCDIIQSMVGDIHNKLYTMEHKKNNLMSPWEFLNINK